jgi:hypothetical protein
MGDSVFGPVYYSSEASVNVLCMSDIVDRSVTYVDNTFEVIAGKRRAYHLQTDGQTMRATCQSTRLHGLSSRASATAARPPQ